MARKATNIEKVENLEPQTTTAVAEATQQVASTPEAAQESTPAAAPHLIVVKRTVNGRWFVYFKGVRPENNPSSSCKTATSAIRYMYKLKHLHGATISQESYDMLKAEQAKEKVAAEQTAQAEPKAETVGA